MYGAYNIYGGVHRGARGGLAIGPPMSARHGFEEHFSVCAELHMVRAQIIVF